MTQQFENVSAVMDGESDDSRVLDQITRDDALAEKWQRYHVIRQGLRKEMPEFADFDISARVAEALEQEPAIVAPKRRWETLPIVGNVVPLVRQGGQLAIAASVAVAMVLGVQQYNQPETEQPFNTAPSIVIPGIQAELSPVSLEQTRPVNNNELVEQRRLINAYMNDHRQQLRLKTVSQPQQAEVENEDKHAEDSPEKAPE